MKAPIELLAFDADDTLWANMALFFEAVDRIKGIIGRYADEASVMAEIRNTETENVSVLGYGIKSFIISMVETAVKASSGEITAHEIQEIISIGRELTNRPVTLLDHVEEVIDELSSRFPLMLLTKGDTFEQERKISGSGLSGYFRYIEIAGEKDARTYSRILEKYKTAPNRFLMVGNSLKSDILPVVEIGGNAAYIPHKDTWYHESVPGGHGKAGYHELDNMGDLPGLIRKLQEPAGQCPL